MVAWQRDWAAVWVVQAVCAWPGGGGSSLGAVLWRWQQFGRGRAVVYPHSNPEQKLGSPVRFEEVFSPELALLTNECCEARDRWRTRLRGAARRDVPSLGLLHRLLVNRRHRVAERPQPTWVARVELRSAREDQLARGPQSIAASEEARTWAAKAKSIAGLCSPVSVRISFCPTSCAPAAPSAPQGRAPTLSTATPKLPSAAGSARPSSRLVAAAPRRALAAQDLLAPAAQDYFGQAVREQLWRLLVRRDELLVEL